MILFCCPMAIMAQAVIDECFEEWNAMEPIYADILGDVSSNRIDLDRLWVSNDEDFVFLRFNFDNGEINLQSDNLLRLYIDIDNDPNTGNSISNIGAELEFRFGERFGIINLPEITTNIDQSDIGLVSLPTVTGSDFELAIRRNFVISGRSVSIVNAIKVLIKDGNSGDQIPDNGDVVEYVIDEELESIITPYQINKRNDSHLRIVSLNTLFDQTFDPSSQASAERIISAIDPDIIAFQEVRSTSANVAANFMDAWIPLPDNKNWFSDKIEPDIIVCSREPILRSAAIDGNGAFFIQNGDENILLINAHLPCCQNEAGRQAEVDNIMSFLRDSKNGLSDIPLPNETPIVILGDMNFVGLSQQRTTLVDGNIINENSYGPDFVPDWDNTNLEMSDIPTTDIPFSYTWENRGSLFWPGRLDYIIYSGSVMRQENGFAVNTLTMSEDNLDQFNLLSFDSRNISDHLMCVADFDLDFVTATTDFDESELSASVYYTRPNLDVTVQIENGQSLNLEIIDPLGRVLARRNQFFLSGKNTVKFNITNSVSGVYFLTLADKNKRKIIPFVVSN